MAIIYQQSQYLAGDHLQHSCFLFHCVPLFRGMGGGGVEVVSGGGGGVTGRDGDRWVVSGGTPLLSYTVS